MTATPERSEVRVLTGPRAGATASVEFGRTLSIGFDLLNDLVVRDPTAKGRRVSLEVTDDTGFLTVLEGDVQLLGQTISQGQRIHLPQCVPFALGASTLAFGDASASAWQACQHVSGAGADATQAQPDALRGTFVKRAAMSTAIVAALAAAFFFLVSVGKQVSAHLRPEQRHVLEKMLAQESYAGLVLVDAEDGTLVIRGELPTEAERVALSQRLQQAQLKPRMDVTTHERIVQAANDVMRVNRTQARVQYVGDGVLHVEAAGIDAARAAQLEQVALRDISGLKQVIFVEAGKLAEAAMPVPAATAAVKPLPHNPRKRVVSVVAGEGGYVMTADGSRYFVGAVLPSGHKIVAFVGDGVLVDKDGATTRLVF